MSAAAEILGVLASDAPSEQRQDAAKALLALLGRLASHPLTVRRGFAGHATYRVPERLRDELVARVVLRIVERRLSIHGRSEGECIRYLQTMMANLLVSEYRAEVRRVPLDETHHGTTRNDAHDGADEDGQSVTHARALLERVFAHALDRRAERYREPLRTAWRQLGELVFEGATMAAVLARDERIDDDAPAAARVKAQNRVFKAHQRLREDLLRAVDELAAAGSLSAEDAATARRACQVLFRCQRSAPRASPGSMDGES